jgi:predicted methyltransferase
MTNAQILQNILLTDMFRRLTDYTDSELMEVKQCAVELRDGKYIRNIQNELNRRIREI